MLFLQQEQIIAMTAQFELVLGEPPLSKMIADQVRACKIQSNRQQCSSSPLGKQGKSGKHKNRKGSNKKAQNEDEKWKKVPPKLEEPKKKKVSNTEWL